MAISADLKFTQGVTTDSAGRALVCTTVDGNVVCSNGDNTGVTQWKYEVLHVPPGSAIPLTVQGPGATATFTMGQPDKPGCYRIRCTVYDGNGGSDVDIRCIGVATPLGYIPPPYQGDPPPLPLVLKQNELNFGGQLNGWMGDDNATRKLLYQFMVDYSPGGPGPQGAAGAQGAQGSSSATERTPMQLVLAEVQNSRTKGWFDNATDTLLLPTALKWVDDPFTDTSTTRFTQLTEDTTGTLSIVGGQATITLPTSGAHSLFLREGAALLVPQVMITADLVSFSGTASGHINACIGIIKDTNNYICASYNTLNGASNVNVQCRIGGTYTFNAAVTHTMVAGSTLGFSLIGNSVVVYVKESGVWTKLTSYDVSPRVNLETQNMSTWYPFFNGTADATTTCTVVFDNFRVGRFGGTGGRDMTVVTNPDGTPYMSGDLAYMLVTIVDAASVGSCAVCTFNCVTRELVMQGLLMNNRAGGGQIYHDHSGHLVIDGATQRLTFSGWDATGAAAVRCYYAAVPYATKDLLAAGSVYAATTALMALTAIGGALTQNWDPFLVKVGSTWYCAYVTSPNTANLYYPVVDSSADLSTWANVGADAGSLRYEGTKIVVANGALYVVAGGRFGMKCWDMGMVFKGWVGGISPGDGTTQPHPQLVPFGNEVLLVSFDQQVWPASGGITFSWGNCRTYASPRY